jgi:hypothetical protein
MNRNFVRRHITTVSIVVFRALFVLLQATKPSFLYDSDGAIREFGLGYSKSTVLPMWAITIVLAIAAYFVVMYWLAIPRMKV